jgi:hypothetical protein
MEFCLTCDQVVKVHEVEEIFLVGHFEEKSYLNCSFFCFDGHLRLSLLLFLLLDLTTGQFFEMYMTIVLVTQHDYLSFY